MSSKWIAYLPFAGGQVRVGDWHQQPVRRLRPQGARPVGGVYPANFVYLPYTGFSPFGFNGRFVYGRVSVDF